MPAERSLLVADSMLQTPAHTIVIFGMIGHSAGQHTTTMTITMPVPDAAYLSLFLHFGVQFL